MEIKKTGLELLREPFEAHQISKLPKPTSQQTTIVKNDFHLGIRCKLCGGWHHKDVIHLDYVGHAALTDRLLDADPEWNWEPLSVDPFGQPVFASGGMWIKLTVCGVTRMGFGDAGDKSGPNAIKEIIGDSLRNAAMRFGAALDLWHKGDLHAVEEEVIVKEAEPVNYAAALKAVKTEVQLKKVWLSMPKELHGEFLSVKDAMKRKLTPIKDDDDVPNNWDDTPPRAA